MCFSRFISVSVSSLAFVCVVILGAFAGCGDQSIPFNEETAVYGKVSGEKAFAHVEKLVSFGPRIAGSPELEESRLYLIEELEKNGWRVQRQEFEQQTPEGKIKFVNLRARFGDLDWTAKVRGILCSHYDTKKFGFRFVGANDAGSSTGLLVEISRVLAEKPELAKTIELVFFDGEEAFGTNITTTDGLYGSKYYASQMVLLPLKKRPKWGILLDMVGDKDLNIRAAVRFENTSIRELRKAQEAGHTIDVTRVKESLDSMARNLIAAASDLGVRSKFGISSHIIIDDHIPLNAGAGIPTIDIIDFDYGNNWHTPGDTLDKISAESLEIVGKVTLLLVEKYL